MSHAVDAVVIGAGIAGLSAAAELARDNARRDLPNAGGHRQVTWLVVQVGQRRRVATQLGGVQDQFVQQ